MFLIKHKFSIKSTLIAEFITYINLEKTAPQGNESETKIRTLVGFSKLADGVRPTPDRLGFAHTNQSLMATGVGTTPG
jgi:hypothetical protein